MRLPMGISKAFTKYNYKISVRSGAPQWMIELKAIHKLGEDVFRPWVSPKPDLIPSTFYIAPQLPIVEKNPHAERAGSDKVRAQVWKYIIPLPIIP
jgi:hypothetical protein